MHLPRVEDVEGSLVVRRWQRSDVAASGAAVLLGVTRPRAVGTGTSHGDCRNGPISDVVVGRRRRRPRRPRRRGRRRRLLQLHVASASTTCFMGHSKFKGDDDDGDIGDIDDVDDIHDDDDDDDEDDGDEESRIAVLQFRRRRLPLLS